jgi:hypothetical protein
MKQIKLLLIIIACANIFVACKKDKTINEIDKLPAVTQIGAKTFGCLINGVAFIPDNGCSYLCTPAFNPSYENSNGGLFAIKATLNTGGLDKSLNIGIDTCIGVGKYIFSTNKLNRRVAFNDYKTGADCITIFSSDNGTVTNGFMDITKFDLSNGIISGTFEFTLSKNACETKTISNGRFDAKF